MDENARRYSECSLGSSVAEEPTTVLVVGENTGVHGLQVSFTAADVSDNSSCASGMYVHVCVNCICLNC